MQVLRDHETYSSRALSEVMGPLFAGAIIAMDEPEHRLHRALVAPAFRPKVLEQWQIEDDEKRASEVEVRFSAIDDDNTRVELRHHGLARHGEGWEGAAAGLEAGWPLYLDRFRQLCAT